MRVARIFLPCYNIAKVKGAHVEYRVGASAISGIHSRHKSRRLCCFWIGQVLCEGREVENTGKHIALVGDSWRQRRRLFRNETVPSQNEARSVLVWDSGNHGGSGRCNRNHLYPLGFYSMNEQIAFRRMHDLTEKGVLL